MERISAPIFVGAPSHSLNRIAGRVEPAFKRAIGIAIIEVAIEVDGPVDRAVECCPTTEAKKRVAFIKFGPAIINPIVARTQEYLADTRRMYREMTWRSSVKLQTVIRIGIVIAHDIATITIVLKEPRTHVVYLRVHE